MLEEILGVVKDVPVPKDEPPVDAAYQFNVPALAVAPNITVPVSQRASGVVPITVGVVSTVACIDVLDGPLQPLYVAST